MKRIFSVILIITLFSLFTYAKYSGGSGIANDPYLIATAEDMNQLGHNQADWNKQFKMTADINLIDFKGSKFQQIGYDESHYFNGVFDGNGHTIWNFNYTGQSFQYYIGIFGYVGSSGVIENLSVKDENINAAYYIGGLVGYNNGTIYNCNSAGKIICPSDLLSAGGLTGYNAGDINDCYSTLTITAGSGSGSLGGLAGENSGNIRFSYASGCIICGDAVGSVGGLAGKNEGNIENCYATNDINCDIDSEKIGGFVGDNDSGSIYNCYSTGNVIVGDGSSNIGGFAGNNDTGIISGCYFLESSGPDNGLAAPLTDANMKKQSSFAGWDFVWETANGTADIWTICQDNNCPKLWWQYLPGDFDNDKNIDFADFARLALKWRQYDSSFYCGGKDLTGDGFIDWKDLLVICNNWLQAN